MYGYEIFHDQLLSKLINNVRTETSANTYIFEGAEGLNKHAAAKLFAQTLVCDNTDNAPCQSCRSCIEAQAGTHPDIICVNPEKGKSSLGVKPVRDMISECLIKPFYDKHKVFIINDGDMLTVEAQNTFLKIIEEPPEYAVFIIVCTDSQMLLQTVRSRSVTISFSPVDDDIVRNYINKYYPDELRTEFLVKYCAGIPKSADNIINNEDFERLREESLNIIPKLMSQKKIHAFAAVEYVEKNKEYAREILDMILLYLRDALVAAMGCPDKIINTDKREKIMLIVQTYSPSLISCASDEIINAKKYIDKYVKYSAAMLHAAIKISN